MVQVDNKELLLIDENFGPILSLEEAHDFNPIYRAFIKSYQAKKDDMPVEQWLTMALSHHLPHTSEDEINEISLDIIDTLKVQEENKRALNKAIKSGRSKESWFASQMKRASSHMSAQEAAKYLQNLDAALENANDALLKTIVTQNGSVNFNLNLDGFIAEQYHVQTFNLNAKASGSNYRAKVLQPEGGQGFKKNSVDIVIVNGNGKIVRRYQSKYGKNAESTLNSFEKGDYRGQRKLVPDGQEKDVKNSSNVIEAPDGTKSNPLSKRSAKDMQKEAQSGKWNDLNWNEYKAKDLAIGIGKQAGQAALMGAAIGTGFHVAKKVWDKEPIEGDELLKTALTSGADFGIKAAVAGALKVGVEKGFVKVISKGTPASTIANIVHIGIENIKVIHEVGKGNLTLKEGVNKLEQVTVSTVAGIAASAKGTAFGAKIGLAFGPVGVAIGGFVGGTIGYMAGSSIGELTIKGIQKVSDIVKEEISSIGNTIQSNIQNAWFGMKQLFS